MKNFNRIVACFSGYTCIALCLGCGGRQETPAVSEDEKEKVIDVSGVWSYWNSLDNTGTMTLTQTGDSVVAVVREEGQKEPWTMKGQVCGDTFTFLVGFDIHGSALIREDSIAGEWVRLVDSMSGTLTMVRKKGSE